MFVRLATYVKLVNVHLGNVYYIWTKLMIFGQNLCSGQTYYVWSKFMKFGQDLVWECASFIYFNSDYLTNFNKSNLTRLHQYIFFFAVNIFSSSPYNHYVVLFKLRTLRERPKNTKPSFYGSIFITNFRYRCLKTALLIYQWCQLCGLVQST